MNGMLRTNLEWEAMFAPQDEETYAAALAALCADDVVLDIGAGDLNFAMRAAARVKQVIALEQHVELLPRAVPHNLQVVCADAREYVFPSDITAAVLLMRHCQHFSLYRDKLEQTGCKKMITNARWGMGVEVIDLRNERLDFAALRGGWYACACGEIGFLENLDSDIEFVAQLENCPACL